MWIDKRNIRNKGKEDCNTITFTIDITAIETIWQ